MTSFLVCLSSCFNIQSFKFSLEWCASLLSTVHSKKEDHQLNLGDCFLDIHVKTA